MNLGNRYTLEKKLGSTAYGDILLARDVKLGRQVIIKTLRVDHLQSKDELEKQRRDFFREAKLAGKLNHEHIVTLYDAGRLDDGFYIAMEHVKGEYLESLLRGPTSFPVQRSLKICMQIAEALIFAHEHGIIHRHLSPKSILIVGDDQVKLQDFGMSSPIVADHLSAATNGAINPSYSAPEIIRGRAVDHRVDIFSLGVILYHMITGNRPFSGRSASSIFHKILNAEPEEIKHKTIPLPDQLYSIISKSLQKEPEHRYQTVTQLLHDLEEVMNVVILMEEKTTISSVLGEEKISQSNDKKPTTTPMKKLRTPLPRKEPIPTPSGLSRSLPRERSQSAHLPFPAERIAKIKSQPVDKRIAVLASEPVDRTQPARKGEFILLLGFLLVFLVFIVTVVWLFWGDVNFILNYFRSKPDISITSGSAPAGSGQDQGQTDRLAREGNATTLPSTSIDAAIIAITSSPERARAYLNGQYLGETPLSAVRIASGTHIVKLELTGYEVWEQKVTLNPNSQQELSATMKLTTSLMITSVPPGAIVSIDGLERGKTPADITGLDPGNHTLRLSLSDYTDHQETIVVSADDHQRSLTIPLRKKASGSIRIKTERGVLISVGGEKKGSGPMTLDRISVGKHTVQLLLAGHKKVTIPVTVLQNKTTDLTHYFLRPGLLRINAIPFGTVWLDGEELGVTPVVVERIPAGDHDLKIVKAGYTTIRQTITIREGKEEQLFLTLEKQD